MAGLPLEQAQDVLRRGPVVFLGSGTSIATGRAFGVSFPGLCSLGDALFGPSSETHRSSPKLPRDEVPPSLRERWERYSEAYATTPDFERVLNDLRPGDGAFHRWIARSIRSMVGMADMRLRRELLRSAGRGRTSSHIPEELALARLLRYLIRGAPPRRPVLHIVTTNYDHVVEYACDMAKIRCHTGFAGHTLKRFERDESKWGLHGPMRSGGRRRIALQPHVRLYKPHGSLNWFQRAHECLECETHPRGAAPLLVAPDPQKYRDVLVTDVFDSHRAWANAAVKRAPSLLVHGYGFNDQHLELDVRGRLRKGLPALLLTRTLTPAARKVLADSPGMIAIEAAEGDRTVWTWDGGRSSEAVDGSTWDLGVFTNEIAGEEVER